MRICPTCSFELKEYNYNFCTNCLNELSQDKIKNIQPHLINVKLDFVLIPDEKFLFFKIPFENRLSFKIIKLLLSFVIIVSIMLFIFYNLNYGF
jgi:hypothetical protein